MILDKGDEVTATLLDDHGAHGSFDARSRDFSTQAWLKTHRGWLLLAGVTGVAFGALLCRRVCASYGEVSIRSEG